MWWFRILFGSLMLVIGAVAIVAGAALYSVGRFDAMIPMIFIVTLVEALFVGFWISAEGDNLQRGAEGRSYGGQSCM